MMVNVVKGVSALLSLERLGHHIVPCQDFTVPSPRPLQLSMVELMPEHCHLNLKALGIQPFMYHNTNVDNSAFVHSASS